MHSSHGEFSLITLSTWSFSAAIGAQADSNGADPTILDFTLGTSQVV